MNPTRRSGVITRIVLRLVALLASWGMQQHEGLKWGRVEVGAACVAIAGLVSSVVAAVPPIVRAWLGDGPYGSRPSGHDA
jgi:hypothetical protein